MTFLYCSPLAMTSNGYEETLKQREVKSYSYKAHHMRILHVSLAWYFFHFNSLRAAWFCLLPLKNRRGSDDPFVVSKTRSSSRSLFALKLLACNAGGLTATFRATYGRDTLTSKKVHSNADRSPA